MEGDQKEVVAAAEAIANDEASKVAQAEAQEAEKIKAIVEQYKTIEEVAKAKRSTDSEYSKATSKVTALEQIIQENLIKSETKIVNKDKFYLLDLRTENPELAEKISLEVFKKSYSEVEVELMKEMEGSLIQTIANDKDSTKSEVVKVSDVDKLVEIKLKEKRLEESKVQLENSKKTESEKLSETFLLEKGIQKDSEEYKEILTTYKQIIGDRVVDSDVAKAALDGSYSIFYVKNKAKLDEIKSKQTGVITGAGHQPIGNVTSNGVTLDYTAQDLASAKIANMNIKDYIELKRSRSSSRK